MVCVRGIDLVFVITRQEYYDSVVGEDDVEISRIFHFLLVIFLEMVIPLPRVVM